eukprot:115858-Chlamydomonas_euryale.AAC.1
MSAAPAPALAVPPATWTLPQHAETDPATMCPPLAPSSALKLRQHAQTGPALTRPPLAPSTALKLRQHAQTGPALMRPPLAPSTALKLRRHAKARLVAARPPPAPLASPAPPPHRGRAAHTSAAPATGMLRRRPHQTAALRCVRNARTAAAARGESSRGRAHTRTRRRRAFGRRPHASCTFRAPAATAGRREGWGEELGVGVTHSHCLRCTVGRKLIDLALGLVNGALCNACHLAADVVESIAS